MGHHLAKINQPLITSMELLTIKVVIQLNYVANWTFLYTPIFKFSLEKLLSNMYVCSLATENITKSSNRNCLKTLVSKRHSKNSYDWFWSFKNHIWI